MKGKIASFIMITSLLATMAMLSQIAPLTADPAVYLKIKLPNGEQFDNTTISAPGGCTKYNITIEVQNVTDLYTWAIKLNWNSSICEYTGQDRISQTPITLTGADRIWIDPDNEFSGLGGNLGTTGINNTLDVLSIGRAGVGDKGTMWPDGNFTLCIIEFHVKDGVIYGENWINFVGIDSEVGTCLICCVDTTLSIIPITDVKAPSPYQAYNAMLKIPKPAPFSPEIKDKVISPGYILECVNVTIDWDVNPGFDGDNPCPCGWSTIDLALPGGAVMFFNVTPVGEHCQVEFHANETGTWYLNITAYAPGVPGDADPTGPWDYDLGQSFTVYEAVETGIDVYEVRDSEKSGEGPDLPGRPYDPQSLVELEAYVFYNDDPVQAKIVSFEVTLCGEECILYRTNMTNEVGIASIEFRIPTLCWEYGGPEELFGKWCVTTTVEMCEVKFNDTMKFDMGYIITLQDMYSCNTSIPWPGNPGENETIVIDDCMPDEFFKKCEYVGFSVTIKNIDWIKINVTVTLVVYDDNEVPIGQIVVVVEVPGGVFCSPSNTTICIGIHIPKYAYVGDGIGYMNAFTALPSECGLAWCPEVSDTFYILSASS